MPIQLSFSIRVSSNVKSVHLVGSWDRYVNQLPLSRDKTSSKSGAWKATFRFSSSQLNAGDRYWYYYVLDNYHCAHNPGLPSTVEPTTGRELNILDVPAEEKKSSTSSSSSSSSSRKSTSHSSSSTSSSTSKRHSSSSHASSRSSSKTTTSVTLEIPRGRPLSISEIKSPKPTAPGQTKAILNFGDGEIDCLSAHLAHTDLSSEENEYRHFIADEDDMDCPPSPVSSASCSSDDDDNSTFSSGYSTPGSDLSDACSCGRYGLTRSGQRILLDCGGSVCSPGYDSDCSIDSNAAHSSRRNGIIVG